MRCLYCDEIISKYSLKSLLFKEDKLCLKCRNQIIRNHRYVKVRDIKVEVFYQYDSLFKSLLIQYKECLDEALKEVFLYDIEEYLKIKYHDYQILYVPSSKAKLKKRNFNHLKLIFESLNLKEVEGLSQITELVQENKNLHERKKMIDNFIYEGKKLNNVLIVDDVLTTGSSIYGVYKAIKNHSNQIKIVCLAYK